MQPISVCKVCGAEISGEARFCRSCGQRTGQFAGGSVTEGTTRLLETPERPAPFNQNVYEHPGHLAQATSRIQPEANPTSRSLEQTRKPARLLLISLIVIITLAFTLLGGLFVALRDRSVTSVSPPVVTKPVVPPVNPPPPPPPPPGSIAQGTGISRAFIYPGAKTTMEVLDESEGNVLQLETSDSIEKVVNWYTEKLKPTKTVKMPGSNVILATDEIKAIITAKGDGTNILLTQGDDE